MSDLARLDERWDIYYHQYLLHTCLHCDLWYFPEVGRRADTLHMFSPSRYGPFDDFKVRYRVNANTGQYYDFHLLNGHIIEQMAWRYIGEGADKDWLRDYVGYDLNMVTIDMIVLTDQDLVN